MIVGNGKRLGYKYHPIATDSLKMPDLLAETEDAQNRASLTGIPRKVFFFRVAEQDVFLPLLPDVFALIDGLEWNEQGRYQPVGNTQSSGADRSVLATFVQNANFPIRLQFARIRRDNLPTVENRGKVSPLMLDENAGLMDCCHLVIYDDGIVSAEFNSDAPRIRLLGQYLFMKARSILPSPPKFLPLFRRDILEELSKFHHVTVLELEARSSEAELVAHADHGLGEALFACRKSGSSSKTFLRLTTGNNKQSTLQQLARKLIGSSGAREALSRLKIIGYKNGEPNRKPLDLLDEYLVSSEIFPKINPKSKMIDSEVAFEVLHKAYVINQPALTNSAQANEIWA